MTIAKRGGNRNGAGRPPSTNPASKLVTVKMTPRQHEQFLLLGGSRWIKRMIDESLPHHFPSEGK